MDKNNRPIGRQEHVTGGSDHVHKRGDGLHSGGQGSGDRGILDDALGSMGSSVGSGMERQVENMLLNEVVAEATGKKKSKGLLIVVAIAAVLFIAFGGIKMLPSLLGGGLSNGLSGSSLSSFGSGSSTGSSGSSSGSWSSVTANANAGKLDKTVASGARDKRTVIKGNGADTITIMVYMCGTDLESKYGMATSDMQEMLKASLSDKINLLIYTGGCTQWKNNVVSSSTNQIYKVENGNLTLLEDNVGSKPMTDPTTLSEYIKWAKGSYPADRYDLIMWDHGGGSTSGYGYDQIYANNGSMTLDKIGTALEDGGCTFDFVGFDACLMATLENALVVEPYADYLIASEESEPGVGWYYTDWLTKLSENTSMSTLDLGKLIVDDFVSACGTQAAGQQTTLSLIDLAELKGTVPDSFKSFASSTTKLINNNEYNQVATARSQTKEFAQSAGIDQVDLINLAENMNTSESNDLAKVLRSAVKYNLTSSNVQHAYGISIYFPYGSMSSVSRMASTYDKIGLDSSYTKCIKSFASVEAGGQTVAGGSSGQLESLFGSLLSGGSSYSSGSTASSSGVEELLGSLLSGRSMPNIGVDSADADFVDQEAVGENTDYLAENQLDTADLVWKEKGEGKAMSLSEKDWSLIQNVELNVFVDDGEGYIDLGLDDVYSFDEDGDLEGNYDQTWMAVNGQIVAYYMLTAEGTQDDYQITGRIPAILNGLEQVDLMVSFTDENPNGEILGARNTYANGETDTQARGLIELKEGDTLDFICNYYDYDKNFIDNYYLGDQMTVNGALEVSNVRMDNTSYIAAFRLTDIYNNHYWTPSM